MDRKLRRRTAAAALVAAAFTAFGAAPSFADTTTSGDGSIGGGNQVQAPVSVPINVCGNSVAVLGKAASQCDHSGATVNNPTGTGDTTTSGDKSVGGGNQVQAPISAPVNICGNAIAAGGEAAAQCKDSGAAVNPPPAQGNNPPPPAQGEQPPPAQGEQPPPDQGNPPPDQGNNPPPNEGSQPPPEQSGNSGGNTSGNQGTQPPPNMVPDQPGTAAAGSADNGGGMANSADNLPFTGSNTAGLAGAALAALGLGALTVWIARRRQSRAQD